MTFSRYQDRQRRITPKETLREQQQDSRDTISHYESPENKINKEKINFPYSEYHWKYGDKLYKLAQRVYGDPKLWWVIAQVNLKPTDNHYIPGDIVIIPNRNSLSKVIEMLGY
jgi:nucleoid-associated protein YgaU